MNENLAQRAWEALPQANKKAFLMKNLMETDLQFADPEFSVAYTNARHEVSNQTERMKLDLHMFDRVNQLQAEGKMLPLEKLRSYVDELMGKNLKSDQLIKAFSDFYRGRQAGKITTV